MKQYTSPKNKRPKKSNKYRAIIASLVALSLLLSGVVYTNYQYAKEISDTNSYLDIVGDLSDGSIQMATDLQHLALIHEPQSNEYQQEVVKVFNRFTDIDNQIKRLEDFKANHPYIINKPSQNQAINAIDQYVSIWQGDYKNRVNQLKTNSSADYRLALANYAREKQEPIFELMVTAYDGPLEHIDTLTRTVEYLQYGTLAGLVLYLLVFFGYALRQMRRSDAQVEAAANEIGEIMQTVDIGLFLLEKDFIIANSYSNRLETLIGHKNLAGKSFTDLLSYIVSNDVMTTAQSFINQLYNPKVKERLISGLNPLDQVVVSIPNQLGKDETRYLNFSFKRIYEEDQISRILVNVSDITSQILLAEKMEEERAQNDLQLEMLSTILKSDSMMIKDFISNIKAHSLNINNILKSPGDTSLELRDKSQRIFREVHSLKGEASALNLHGFTVIAENIENELKQMQNSRNISGENFLGLAVSLEEIMNLTQVIEDLSNRLGSSNTTAPNQASGSPLQHYYQNFVQELAERNHKKVDFTCLGMEKVQNEQVQTLIREAAIQLLRNAVVHGIETPQERITKNKLPAGHVRMELETDAKDSLLFRLEDDGRGIDYEAIRAKAVKLGLYSTEAAAALTQKDLLKLIFSSGFSTLDEATGDAGRGIGLDIIRDKMVALGGKIAVSSTPDAYTRFTFTFPKETSWVMKEVQPS